MSKVSKVSTPAIVLDATRVQFFPVSLLNVSPDYNVRMFDPENNAEDKRFVGQLVAEGKVNTPLVARIVGGNIEIMQGHRRRAAVLYALEHGLVKTFPSLPVLGAAAGMSEIDRTYDIGTSNSGKKLSAIENARLVARLVKLGEKPAKIAARLGLKSTKWVSELDRMATMPGYLAEAVYGEHIAGTLALDLIREAESKKFDLTAVWTGASDAARDKSKWDAELAAYVWRVTQKHLDSVLETMGKAMDKSRIETRAPRTTTEAAPVAPTTPVAPVAPTTPVATVGTGKSATPVAPIVTKSTAPLYTIAADGITLKDANGNRLAIAEDSTVARELLSVLTMSGRAISARPLATATKPIAKVQPAPVAAPAKPVAAPAKPVAKPSRAKAA